MAPADISRVIGALSKKYRVLTELGEGGMSHVYLAMAQGLAGFNKLVVLKVLKSELAGNPELRDGFLREARLSARMGHPNVVAVNEIEELDGTPVIIMEYLQGLTLSAIRRRLKSNLPLDIHLRILSDSLSGLHYAHELTDFDGAKLRLVHRDFSPQNIFVTFDGSVKVLDFGIAQATRRRSDSTKNVTRGKLRYMSPEQFVAAPLDRRADVFAAGVMLCEAVTGQRFWGNLTDANIVERLVSGKIPTPRSIDPACPDELVRICCKALAFDRACRYETIAELQEEVESFVVARLRRVTSQELGRQLASWFENERKQAQQLIETRLWDEKFASCSHISVVPTEATKSNTPPVALTASASPPALDSARYPPSSKQFRWRLLRWTGPALAAVSIAVAAMVLLRGSVLPTAKDSSQAHSMSGAPKTSTIRIVAFPPSAGLVIDDVPVAQNPFVKEVVADESWHRVRAQAPGYRPAEHRYQLNHDVELVISLEEDNAHAAAPATTDIPVPALPAHAMEVQKATHARTSVVSSARPQRAQKRAKVWCSPPYTYDQRGLKHFKPECM